MTRENSIHPFADEAANPDTPPEHLAVLSRERVLMPLIAGNPATPASTLEILGKELDKSIRAALVQNPNTPVALLVRLADEFPDRFLANPVLPLLNLSQPDFIKNIPTHTWLHLLRFENVPEFWLRLLQQGSIRPGYDPYLKDLQETVQTHILITGELTEGWEQPLQTVLKQYKKHANRYSRLPKDLLLFLLTVPVSDSNLISLLQATGTTHKKLVVNSYPAMNGEVLAALSTEQELSLLCAIARHSHTPLSILEELAGHSELPVRRAVAYNSSTPTPLLHQLAGDKAVQVRRAVASHRQTTLTDLETLALDDEVPVRATVARHSQLDEDLFALLLGDDSAEVRAALARNVHAPAYILTVFAYDNEASIRCEVARNPRLPKEAYAVLQNDLVDAVRYNLARNSQLPQEMFSQLFNDPAPLMHAYLAMNPRAPLSLLKKLVKDNDMDTWKHIARNPHTSQEMLTYLAERGDEEVRAAVAGNTHTPAEVLQRLLSYSGDFYLTNAQLANPHTPLEGLESILDSHNPHFYLKAAHHPATQQNRRRTIFERFLMTIKNDVAPSPLRLALLECDDIPLAVLAAFARSAIITERCLVALHPGVSRALLESLTHDGNCYVRALARTTLANRKKSRGTL